MKNDNLFNEKIIVKKIKTNNVTNRFLPLSESVLKGLEPEPKIEDFEMLKQIGSGSFGNVYLAEHIKTHVKYAIKIIDKKNKANLDGKPYFRREIEIMYKIKHPNCVRLFGNFEDENFCYFIMEYVPNGNLYTLMASNRSTGLNIYLVASIMRQLVSAIYYLHNMNPPIIHRDIKPENILLKDSNIKLTDFGWSNYINFEGEQRSTFCGTPIYLAPEMIQNLGHDEHVDIWCLGVLLFELLTGIPPFIGQNRSLLMKNIINVNITWPSPPRLPIDPDAKDLISKILKKVPAERISLENIAKHKFFLKYCPNIKPVLSKKQQFHLKPYIVSRDIPNDDFYDSNDIENELNKYDIKQSIRSILKSSNKKNKIRDITPSPPGTRLCLENKNKYNNNNINNNLFQLNSNNQLKVWNDSKKIDMPKGDDYETIKTFEFINDIIKEKGKLEKEVENYKLREIGYKNKIEELSFVLNNISQEYNMLKLDLEKYKKELEKKQKEIRKLRSNLNLNLNLNNQTTVNINTSKDSNLRSNNSKGLIKKGNSRQINNNTIMRTFVSKTPEGVLRKGRKIILTNNSYLKPHLKKNIKYIQPNKSMCNEELNKKKESSNIDSPKLNKNISYNDIIKEKNNEIHFKLKEKQSYKELILKLQRENHILKEENKKFKKNYHKNLSKDSSHNPDNKK